MKTQEALLAGGVGAGLGALVGYALTPTSFQRALYATADSAQAGRIAKILETNGISSTTTAPSLDPTTVTLVGQNKTTLYVILVSQGDFERALEVLPK